MVLDHFGGPERAEKEMEPEDLTTAKAVEVGMPPGCFFGYRANLNTKTGAFEYSGPWDEGMHDMWEGFGFSMVSDDHLAELRRKAARWDSWAEASAEASGLQRPMEQISFFQSLRYHSGFGITRKFTADQLGHWVDQVNAHDRCRKCEGQMHEGIAMGQTTYTGSEGTCSPGGPGQVIDCMKCRECGWSVTKGGAECQP